MSISRTTVPRLLAKGLTCRFIDGKRFVTRDARVPQEEGEREYPRVEAIKASLMDQEVESGRVREISRDMRDQAESSRSSSSRRLSSSATGINDLSSNPPFYTYRSKSQPSISESLNPSWRDRNPQSSPPPRPRKGVLDRHKRSQGMTPGESHSINALLAQMLEDTTRMSNPGFPLGARNDLYPTPRFFSPPPLPNQYQQTIPPRILERLETEEDIAMLEELDALKEDMTTCRTDVDLINWAKEKVFKPKSTSPAEAGQRYSPVYPRILAHLLSHIRRNYNNPHLVLALFHHAQIQSPESYLSGCLAPAYNEILKTRWESFKDLEGVESLLQEMEANGVAWDRQTANIINKTVNAVGKEVFMGTGWQEKYGKNVHMRLAQLEEKLQKDIQLQNRAYESRKKEKAMMREQARRTQESIERFKGVGEGRDNYA